MNYNKTGYALRYHNGKLAGRDFSSGPYSTGGYEYPVDDIKDAWVSSLEEVKAFKEVADPSSQFLEIVEISINVETKSL